MKLRLPYFCRVADIKEESKLVFEDVVWLARIVVLIVSGLFEMANNGWWTYLIGDSCRGNIIVSNAFLVTDRHLCLLLLVRCR